jgi:hypothetical protein
MPAAEMDAMVAQFDREFVPTAPLTAAMRAQHERAKRKRGRPRIGKGSKDVMISVEKDLLKQADRYAKTHGISRSELFARGVKIFLKAS